MKHLFNNLTEQEKNNIRKQHTGGMQVNNSRFNTLLENKLGNDKPLVEKFDDEDDMYSINEGVNVVPKGKSDLIQVLINKINYMEKNNEFNAMDVAKTIYNNCANFMNKADIFSDKTKYGEDVVQPPAEFAKREQVPESSIDKDETDSTETQY